ncbi:hypothetical protein RRG08_039977 [Elysia crispata]|uniref:Uncharacterized protein n=1 Tax=Elysia crispata TaxID=231223 RepID=A0AAE0Z9A0_9GAST|nr:hypothetical protein RRG08_039977 [Elysia crispata]
MFAFKTDGNLRARGLRHVLASNDCARDHTRRLAVNFDLVLSQSCASAAPNLPAVHAVLDRAGPWNKMDVLCQEFDMLQDQKPNLYQQNYIICCQPRPISSSRTFQADCLYDSTVSKLEEESNSWCSASNFLTTRSEPCLFKLFGFVVLVVFLKIAAALSTYSRSGVGKNVKLMYQKPDTNIIIHRVPQPSTSELPKKTVIARVIVNELLWRAVTRLELYTSHLWLCDSLADLLCDGRAPAKGSDRTRVWQICCVMAELPRREVTGLEVCTTHLWLCDSLADLLCDDRAPTKGSDKIRALCYTSLAP